MGYFEELEEEDLNPGAIATREVICQGPPRCNLIGEDAHIAQMDGCRWCQVLITDRLGRETLIEPGEA